MQHAMPTAVALKLLRQTPKGMSGGEPTITVRVERSMYPKSTLSSPPSKRKRARITPYKPKPMDVRVVSVKRGARL